MTRTLFALTVAGVLVAPAVAAASLESEVVQDYQPMASQIVQAPNDARWFGLPNVSEFDPEPARTAVVGITPYPDETIQDRDD